MARTTRPLPADRPGDKVTPGEIAVLERLVERGALVTMPALHSQKPRKVMAASLDDHGRRVLLYLSAKPIGLP
jgi:hypothetical protein